MFWDNRGLIPDLGRRLEEYIALQYNIRALIIKIRFRGPLYFNHNQEPPKYC